MTDWNKIGEKAEAKTDAELAAGIEKLLASDIGKLFPAPDDKAKVDGLIKAIRAKTAYNERVAAFRAVSATLGGELLKGLKKAMFCLAVALLVGLGQAGAQEAVKAIDMNAPLADARIGLAWDLAGEQLGVAYVPVIYIVGADSGREYATLNLGASDKLDTGRAGYLASFGFRMDTIFSRLGETRFAKKYLRFAVLPPMQISPCFVTGDFKRFVPMISVSTKFGGR